MNEQKLPNAGTNLIPLQVIHKILKGSRAGFWLLLILFLGLSSGTAYSQASLSTGSNPAVVVKMGDPLSFSVNVTSTTAMTNAEIEIKAPAGFEILSANPALKPGSLSGDKLSARVVTNLIANTQQTITFSVKSLCNADVVVSASRLITYNLYASGSSTVLATKNTQSIGNFYNPIISPTFPASGNVTLNQENTRTILIEQTATNSYVNNLQITAAGDTSGLKITKIEVSSDNLTWTDVTSSALNTSASNKYVYTFTKANTFTPLGYPNNHLDVGQKFYIRETAILKKCSKGGLNYSISYGDGTTFCSVVATGNVTVDAASIGYSADIETLGGSTYPSSLTENGKLNFRFTNNSADALAKMFNVYVNVYNNNGVQYIYKRAYFSTTTTDTTFIPLTPNGASVWKVNFSQLPDVSANPAEAVKYAAFGLNDLDGDGIYDDLDKGKAVNIIVEYNIVFSADLNTDCATATLFPSTTRRADFWYENTCGVATYYTRAYSINNIGAGTTNSYMYGTGHGASTVSLSKTNVDVNDQVTLSLYESQGANTGIFYSNLGGTNINNIYVTLPKGFKYDAAATNPIKINGIAVNIADITQINDTLVKFRNKITIYNPTIEIIMRAVSEVDDTKCVKMQYGFIFKTGQEYIYGCSTVPVSYIQKQPCNRLELADFKAERTTYGYRSTSDLTRITDADPAVNNINKQAAGPYDNVSMTASVHVRSNTTLAPGEKVMATVSYEKSNNLPYFNAGQGVKLRYKQNGSSSFTDIATIPASSIIIAYNAPVHSLTVDISSYIGSGQPILALGMDDELEIEFLTQTTLDLPIPAMAISNFQMEVYTQYNSVKTACSPLVAAFKVYDYAPYRLGNSNNNRTYNVNTTDMSANLVALWYWYKSGYGSYGDQPTVFTNEFRPNTVTSNYVIKLPSLVDVTELSASSYGVLTAGTDYLVTYSNGSTIITLLKNQVGSTPIPNVFGGWAVNMKWNAICWNSQYANISVSLDDYPTAEVTRPRTLSSSSESMVMIINNYQYALTTSAPSQSPKGRYVEWPLNIANKSIWAGTDPILPNSWIAFECNPGVVPYQLIDVDNGNAVIADIANSDFVSYGASDKYWVKLNNLNVPTSHNLKLVCTYSVCTGTPSVLVKYGMSKVAYPNNPQDGYSQAPYNSPGTICSVVSTSVNFTPPVANFTGALAHTPDNILDGTNNFCSDIDFAATFTNGLQTKVSNMVLKVTLPVGMDYNGVLPTVKLGSGAAVAVTNAVQTGRLLAIEVSPTLELDAYGSADQSAVVHFALTTGCGFVSGQQIYADFIGESGCGAKTTKAYNSSQVKIAGLSVIADYLVGGKTITSQLPYQDATTNTGRIVFTGKYVLSGAATPDDAAFIDLPGDMNLTAQSGDLTFTQTGNRLSAFFDITGTAPSGKNYDFTLTLDPVNPANWDCDSTHYIKVKSGIIKTITCGLATCDLTGESSLKDSVGFTMNKLDIALSPVIKVTSVYQNATTERVKIDGKLKNLSATATGQFIFDLYTHNGTTYVPVGAPGNMVVNAVPANDSTAFTLQADIPNTEDICKLKLVLRTDNMTAGMSNNYLCDSIVYIFPSTPVYDLQPVNPVCPMAVNTPVGDNAITGYGYNWSPSTYLSTTTVAKPNFTYNYLATPVYNDTVIGYKVTITRPGGCSSVDSVYIPVKALGYVNFVADTTLCNATPLSITFADSANTSANPTTYTWTNSNTAIGLGASGSGNINVGSLTNTTLLPITATITVTPTRNGCTGVAKSFVVTVLPEATITSQPSIDPAIVLSNGYIRPGSNVELSVASTIGLNVTYQWYWKRLSDGVVITLSDDTTYVGTTTDTLLIKNAYEEENGDYYVTVTGCGSATSNPVTVIAVANQDASLKDLKINGTTLPNFNPAKTDYMTTVVCNDEYATILATPNNANITSLTGNGTFSLLPGDNIFSIVIVAQDMVTTMTYTVNVIRDCYVPKILKDLEDAVICVGDTHTFEVIADGQGLTYEWYYGLNRIMGASSSTYTVSASELRDYELYQVIVRSNYNGFKSSAYSKKARLWVADHLPTTLQFATCPNPAVCGQTYHMKLAGYTDVTKYTWSYDRDGVSFSRGSDPFWGNEAWATFGTLAAGNGTLKVTMEHPCGTREITRAITVKYSTGVEDVTATMVQVYPNPTSGIVKVSNTEANQMIRVTDVTGSTKGTYKTQEGTTTIDLTGYAKGTYMVQYNGKTYKVIRK